MLLLRVLGSQYTIRPNCGLSKIMLDQALLSRKNVLALEVSVVPSAQTEGEGTYEVKYANGKSQCHAGVRRVYDSADVTVDRSS